MTSAEKTSESTAAIMKILGEQIDGLRSSTTPGELASLLRLQRGCIRWFIESEIQNLERMMPGPDDIPLDQLGDRMAAALREAFDKLDMETDDAHPDEAAGGDGGDSGIDV